MNTRLLFIDETAQVGGAQKNLHLLAKNLWEARQEILVVLPEYGAFGHMLAESGIPVKIIPGVPGLSLSFYLGGYKIPNPVSLLVNWFQGLLWSMRLLRLARLRAWMARQICSMSRRQQNPLRRI